MAKRIFLKSGLLMLMALLAMLVMTATPALAAPSWQRWAGPLPAAGARMIPSA